MKEDFSRPSTIFIAVIGGQVSPFACNEIVLKLLSSCEVLRRPHPDLVG